MPKPVVIFNIGGKVHQDLESTGYFEFRLGVNLENIKNRHAKFKGRLQKLIDIEDEDADFQLAVSFNLDPNIDRTSPFESPLIEAANLLQDAFETAVRDYLTQAGLIVKPGEKEILV